MTVGAERPESTVAEPFGGLLGAGRNAVFIPD
jgi:hypothetical protein